jgi:hypothetical protein
MQGVTEIPAPRDDGGCGTELTVVIADRQDRRGPEEASAPAGAMVYRTLDPPLAGAAKVMHDARHYFGI